MMSTLHREINAVTAIAGRQLALVIKSPVYIIVSLLFPIMFIGILGESMAQNLAGGLGFNFLQFMLIGMIVNSMFQSSVTGMSQLVEERKTNFTQELFVSPISRYSIIVGKIIGSSFTNIIMLFGIMVVALILQIPLGGMSIVWLLLVSPLFSLVGAALGIFFISFVTDSKVADFGSMLLIMPQMFLSGALIPVNHSTGILNFLAHIMPMTYCVDLARAVFYAGDPAYDRIVMFNPALDLIVMAGFFFIFSIIGTIVFARAEQNR
ncbi:ABC transporter permease [Neobacillus drentensis]|uniref:ABC transporter permease n=1 Tax=Neobacillus drentensis TaxID=220684 RepID=UPI002FFE515F